MSTSLRRLHRYREMTRDGTFFLCLVSFDVALIHVFCVEGASRRHNVRIGSSAGFSPYALSSTTSTLIRPCSQRIYLWRQHGTFPFFRPNPPLLFLSFLM